MATADIRIPVSVRTSIGKKFVTYVAEIGAPFRQIVRGRISIARLVRGECPKPLELLTPAANGTLIASVIERRPMPAGWSVIVGIDE